MWIRDGAARSLLVPLGDIVSFSVRSGAAIWYRARPEVHKRLMVVATVVLLFAAEVPCDAAEAGRVVRRRRHPAVAGRRTVPMVG
jgi:hypothetical protein